MLQNKKNQITVISYDKVFLQNLSKVVDIQFANLFSFFFINEFNSYACLKSKFIVINATVNPFGVINYVKAAVEEAAEVVNNDNIRSIPILMIVSNEFIKNKSIVESVFNNVKYITSDQLSNAEYLNSIFSVMSLGFESFSSNNNAKVSYNNNDEDKELNIVLDENSYRAIVNGKPVHLCQINFKILSLLVARENEVVTRQELIEQVWKDNSISSRTVDVHIKRIRDKLIKNGDYRNSPLKTVRNLGYYYYKYTENMDFISTKDSNKVNFIDKKDIRKEVLMNNNL